MELSNEMRLLDLADEILLSIAKYLSFKDLLSFSSCNTQLRRTLDDVDVFKLDAGDFFRPLLGKLSKRRIGPRYLYIILYTSFFGDYMKNLKRILEEKEYRVLHLMYLIGVILKKREKIYSSPLETILSYLVEEFSTKDNVGKILEFLKVFKRVEKDELFYFGLEYSSQSSKYESIEKINREREFGRAILSLYSDDYTKRLIESYELQIKDVIYMNENLVEFIARELLSVNPSQEDFLRTELIDAEACEMYSLQEILSRLLKEHEKRSLRKV